MGKLAGFGTYAAAFGASTIAFGIGGVKGFNDARNENFDILNAIEQAKYPIASTAIFTTAHEIVRERGLTIKEDKIEGLGEFSYLDHDEKTKGKVIGAGVGGTVGGVISAASGYGLGYLVGYLTK